MAVSLMLALLIVGSAAVVQCQDDEQKVLVQFPKFHPFTKRTDDFQPINTDCDGDTFKGLRFMKSGDPSFIRIEDKQGKFVGSQTGFYVNALKTAIEKKNPEQVEKTIQWYENNPQVEKETIEGQEVYLMTAYIQKPDTICGDSPGDSSTNIFVKNREVDDGYIKVDRLSDSNWESEGWVKNPCIPKMGDHYRYKVKQAVDYDCKNWNPIFLLSTGGKIVGWGWNFPGFIKNDNFENVPDCLFKTIMDPMPECVMEDFRANGGYTSQHVYIYEDPTTIECSKPPTDDCPK